MSSSATKAILLKPSNLFVETYAKIKNVELNQHLEMFAPLISKENVPTIDEATVLEKLKEIIGDIEAKRRVIDFLLTNSLPEERISLLFQLHESLKTLDIDIGRYLAEALMLCYGVDELVDARFNVKPNKTGKLYVAAQFKTSGGRIMTISLGSVDSLRNGKIRQYK